MSEVAVCKVRFTTADEKKVKIIEEDGQFIVELDDVPEEDVLKLAARIKARRLESSDVQTKRRQDAAEKRVRDFFFRAEVPGEGAL